MRSVAGSISKFLLVTFILGCSVTLGGDHSEKTAARRKARFEFMKKEHEKRWSFEDELLSFERSFADGIRKDRREAEQKRDAALADATDAKGEAEARRSFAESEKELRKKVADERKSIAEKRKIHMKELDELRREFLKDLNKKP